MAFQSARKLVQEGSVVLLFAWIEMLEDDSQAAVAKASSFFTALPGIFHFHDPERAIARAVARSMGAADMIAWDFYLTYAKGILWSQTAPVPLAWFHQLQDEDWAGHDHFRWGRDLGPAIRQALKQALGFRAA